MCLQDQCTPLYTASCRGFVEVVKSLIAANADVNYVCVVVSCALLHIFVCKHAHVNMHMYTCVYVCMRVCVCMCIHGCELVPLCVCMCVYLCLCVGMHLYKCVYMNVTCVCCVYINF